MDSHYPEATDAIPFSRGRLIDLPWQPMNSDQPARPLVLIVERREDTCMVTGSRRLAST
jgi:hypothetical protein